ncbi:hypothetical protein KC19_4G065200 [Ceratodon purpureus]|uniref:EF-hand domain-containing protein n=1 Tax=Ceratodon purpureus TaxID=3225 RepID=A0A8T0I8I5_CERPU|nr:hypothetical protein KC19_4G065200 [Ceratodon purpureus]
METSGSSSDRSEIEEVVNLRRPQADVGALPDHLVKDLREDFKMFDLNGDGKISRKELGKVLWSLGERLSDADVDQMIRDADANGDGEIDFEEFINLNANSADIQTATVSSDLEDGKPCASSLEMEALQSAFNVFDSNKDGFISAGELHRVLSCLGDDHISIDDCRYMISCVDIDGNQLVDFKEFQTLMSSGHPDRSQLQLR